MLRNPQIVPLSVAEQDSCIKRPIYRSDILRPDHRIHEPPRETVSGYLAGICRPSKFTSTVPIMGRSDARRLYLSADPRETVMGLSGHRFMRKLTRLTSLILLRGAGAGRRRHLTVGAGL